MNPLVGEIPPSLIRSIAARRKPGDIDLGLGEPTLPPDIEPFERAVEWTRRNGSPYSPNAGFPELREAIAEYLNRGRLGEPNRHPEPLPRHPGQGGGVGGESRRDGEFRATNVCVTVGSEEALYLAIKTVADPVRHEVLIVEPCYLAYPKLCMLEGIRHRMVSLSKDNDFAPNAGAVLSQVTPATRLIIINTPSNPTGRVWPASELQALARGLAGAADDPIYVLADEVYREIYFGDSPPESIASWYTRTLIAGSLSKSSSLTGLRLGWLAGPEEVIVAATKVHQFVNTAASTFSQRVALELFGNPGNLTRNRNRYVEARERLVGTADVLGLRLIPPEGAFYGFIRLPPRYSGDSLALAEHLLDDQRVLTVPGRAFGASGEGWLRISWVAPSETVEEGLHRIAAVLADS